MDKNRQRRLEANGWKVGTVQEFLHLAPEELAYIELKLHPAKTLQRRRRAKRLTQVEVARLLKSSQSRIAKTEAGDPSVSVDLLVRSLLALGVRSRSVSRALPQ